MNADLVDRIVNALLYEGYILYPYRQSVKNRQRWTFGGLYPSAYCIANKGSDGSSSQTECLIEGASDTILHVTVRFLHLIERIADGQVWQEAEERRIELNGEKLATLSTRPQRLEFGFPCKHWIDSNDGIVI